MDVLGLINEARAAGLHLQPEGRVLKVRGPKSAEKLVQRLMRHKSAVISALQTVDDDCCDLQHVACPAVVVDTGSILMPMMGVEHRRADCRCRHWWEHVDGGFFCCECFAPVDRHRPVRRPPR